MAGLDLLWGGEEWRKALRLEGYLGSEIQWTRLMDLERGVTGEREEPKMIQISGWNH